MTMPHTTATTANTATAAANGRRPGFAGLRRYTHALAPALQRGSMVPTPWRGLRDSLRGRSADDAPVLQGADQPAGRQRRRVLIGLMLAAMVGATTLQVLTQPMVGFDPLRLLQVALFALLFGWVTAGCATAVMGWWALRRGLAADGQSLSFAAVAQNPVAADARTAVIMPICNEQVAVVFAGLAATGESIVAAGGARLCELYVLSDSSDPALRAAERQAALTLRERFATTGLRVHYRWRARRTQRKAGNVADFCRRWGRRHRYMVVLDADSVMSGEAVLGLVRLMEAQPRAGIIQSIPVACGLDTPHARAQQFAGRVTGRLFAAGMQHWQLGESHYWGHNAIIRIAPFMAHCGLARIPGRGGLAGEILSHDFVEAALMRRAGWQVRMATDLPGSWEQNPPHLMAELQRDRRWCQGNLQNAQLITEPGLHPVHRAMFATGAMAYLSAPLWLTFIALGLVLWLQSGHSFPQVMPAAPLLALWAATVGLLMLPRLLGVALVLEQRQQAGYGGTAALIGSALLEALLSALQAPVRMAAHSLFVLGALTGLKLQWRSPPREATALPWRDAAPALLPLGAVAGIVLALAAWAAPGVALWLLPVAAPLLLAWPLAVWAGRPAAGQWLRRFGLLQTPEETRVPRELQQAWNEAVTAPVVPSLRLVHSASATALSSPSRLQQVSRSARRA